MTVDLPPAIIFDMDDTILADDATSDICWEQVLREFSSHIPGVTTHDLIPVLRDVRRWYWSDPDRNRWGDRNLREARVQILSLALNRHGVRDDVPTGDMVDVYMELRASTVQFNPGAEDALESLRSAGVKLGLITNGDAQGQRSKVARAGLEPYFESVLLAGEFGVAKPDPRVFHHTLEQLQATPDQAWMVGDNLHADVGGAQAVGIYGVWVDWQGIGLPEDSPVKPDRIVRSISELVNQGRAATH